jgi:hypothetical protein
MPLSFSQHYFTEAKIQAWRQIANLFAQEKKFGVNINKDLKQIYEIDEKTFTNLNNTLAGMYREGDVEFKYRYRLLKKDEKKQAKKEKENTLSITNVYKGILKGDKSQLQDLDYVIDCIVYESGKRLIYNGYIVMIVTRATDGNDRYYIGADRNGLFFFKEIFGMNLSMYTRIAQHNINRLTSRQLELPGRVIDRDKEKRGEYDIGNDDEEKLNIVRLGFLEVPGGRNIYLQLKNKLVDPATTRGNVKISKEYANKIKSDYPTQRGKYTSGFKFTLPSGLYFQMLTNPNKPVNVLFEFENKKVLDELKILNILTDIKGPWDKINWDAKLSDIGK